MKKLILIAIFTIASVKAHAFNFDTFVSSGIQQLDQKHETYALQLIKDGSKHFVEIANMKGLNEASKKQELLSIIQFARTSLLDKKNSDANFLQLPITMALVSSSMAGLDYVERLVKTNEINRATRIIARARTYLTN